MGEAVADLPHGGAFFHRRARTVQIYKLAKYLEFVQGGMPTVASLEASR
jgi:hypothetical protein